MDKPRTIFSYIGNLWYGVICFFENNYKVLEIVLTTAALLVAGYLFYETHTQSNERAEENFIIENRAWVGVSQSNGSGDLEVYIKTSEEHPPKVFVLGKLLFSVIHRQQFDPTLK